jgi:formylglycine-generating enzyme required for sulfatase activity
MSFGRLERAGVARILQRACVIAFMSASAASYAQAPWPANLYNPQATAGDVVLPMPCGGAMTFRPVYVPSANALDDRRIQIGNPDARFAYAENTRSDYVAGGFTDPKQKSQRYFLIGKYEVTTLQFEALTGKCPAVNPDGRMPKTAITWNEAVNFTARYSDWLAKNAAGKVPSEDGSIGFVRLPTEEEWEFAARGGIAVQEAVFEQPAFPMPEGPQRYVWFAGTESSNNELNAIGLLKPNPLGLHDILGNAGEFVLDPFRLNKHSRMHGQAGGYTVKGGDFRTAQADIRSSARTEYDPIDQKGERRDKATGFRIVIVPAALTTQQKLQSVRTLWTSLAQSSPSAAQAQPLADPVKEVEALAKAVGDPAVKSRIEGVGAVIRANIQARNEQRERSAKSELRVGAYLGRKVTEDLAKIAKLEEVMKLQVPENIKKDARENLAASRENVDATLNYMMDTLKQIGLDYPAATTSAQGEILKREFESRKVPGYAPLIDLAVRHAQNVRSGKPMSKNELTAELRKLQQQERK